MIHHLLEDRLRTAVREAMSDVDLSGIVIRPCADKRFGDYQTSSLISLAKQRKMNPRQLAANVLAKLTLTDCCEKVELAGAGFLNFTLQTAFIGHWLRGIMRGERGWLRRAGEPQTVVIDFSSPNVAKPMHVGHIRSTILGDVLARVFRVLGHRVITDNHIGDWGTQFGKLLVGWKRFLDPESLKADPISEMERLYKLVNTASEADPSILEAARQELVRLQNADMENLRLWQEMIRLSQQQFDTNYRRLDIQFDHSHGESFYNHQIKPLVEDFLQRGIAQESEGAVVVFFEDPAELKNHPMIIRKSDGAANYATTDLATLAYRWETWRPDKIIYVTDGRQQLHFQQVFAAFRKWRPAVNVILAHVWFGSILGEDGKPFKTRSGETIRLADLLNEAEERAYHVVTAKNPDLTERERRDIARVVGIGAVKYADLLPNRQSDYVFNWDKMLAFSGNTAPYLLYAYTRIRSIFRKMGTENLRLPDEGTTDGFEFSAVEEIVLAKHLLHFGFVLEAVAEEYRPNYLCNYLFELAGHFARFYECCPVLRPAGPQRTARLALCELSGRVIQQGLEVLGIATTEKM